MRGPILNDGGGHGSIGDRAVAGIAAGRFAHTFARAMTEPCGHAQKGFEAFRPVL
jgi:hypothetical protein